MAYNEVDQ